MTSKTFFVLLLMQIATRSLSQATYSAKKFGPILNLFQFMAYGNSSVYAGIMSKFEENIPPQHYSSALTFGMKDNLKVIESDLRKTFETPSEVPAKVMSILVSFDLYMTVKGLRETSPFDALVEGVTKFFLQHHLPPTVDNTPIYSISTKMKNISKATFPDGERVVYATMTFTYELPIPNSMEYQQLKGITANAFFDHNSFFKVLLWSTLKKEIEFVIVTTVPYSNNGEIGNSSEIRINITNAVAPPTNKLGSPSVHPTLMPPIIGSKRPSSSPSIIPLLTTSNPSPHPSPIPSRLPENSKSYPTLIPSVILGTYFFEINMRVSGVNNIGNFRRFIKTGTEQFLNISPLPAIDGKEFITVSVNLKDVDDPELDPLPSIKGTLLLTFNFGKGVEIDILKLKMAVSLAFVKFEKLFMQMLSILLGSSVNEVVVWNPSESESNYSERSFELSMTPTSSPSQVLSESNIGMSSTESTPSKLNTLMGTIESEIPSSLQMKEREISKEFVNAFDGSLPPMRLHFYGVGSPLSSDKLYKFNEIFDSYLARKLDTLTTKKIRHVKFSTDIINQQLFQVGSDRGGLVESALVIDMRKKVLYSTVVYDTNDGIGEVPTKMLNEILSLLFKDELQLHSMYNKLRRLEAKTFSNLIQIKMFDLPNSVYFEAEEVKSKEASVKDSVSPIPTAVKQRNGLWDAIFSLCLVCSCCFVLYERRSYYSSWKNELGSMSSKFLTGCQNMAFSITSITCKPNEKPFLSNIFKKKEQVYAAQISNTGKFYYHDDDTIRTDDVESCFKSVYGMSDDGKSVEVTPILGGKMEVPDKKEFLLVRDHKISNCCVESDDGISSISQSNMSGPLSLNKSNSSHTSFEDEEQRTNKDRVEMLSLNENEGTIGLGIEAVILIPETAGSGQDLSMIQESEKLVNKSNHDEKVVHDHKINDAKLEYGYDEVVIEERSNAEKNDDKISLGSYFSRMKGSVKNVVRSRSKSSSTLSSKSSNKIDVRENLDNLKSSSASSIGQHTQNGESKENNKIEDSDVGCQSLIVSVDVTRQMSLHTASHSKIGESCLSIKCKEHPNETSSSNCTNLNHEVGTNCISSKLEKKTGNYLKSSKGNQRGAFTFKDANSYSSHSPVSAPVEFTDDVAKKHFFTEKQDFTRDTVKEKYAIKQGSGLRITPVGSMNAVELTLSIDNKSTEESCFGSPNSRVSQLSNSSVIDTPSNQLDDKKDQIEKRTDTRQTCQSSRAFLIATQGSGLSLVSSTSSAFRRVNSKNSYLFEDTMAKNLVSEDITSLPSDQDLPSSMHGYEDHCSLKVPKMENFYPNKDSQEHVSSFTKLMSKMRWSKKGLGIKADVSMSSSKSSGASINHFKKRSLDTDYIIRNNASNPFSSTDETEVISNNAHASNRRRKTEGGDIIQNFLSAAESENYEEMLEIENVFIQAARNFQIEGHQHAEVQDLNDMIVSL